jgi:hypothetical protein
MRFKQYIKENRRLKTQKGSAIKRSKYGVGKLIGGFLYLHKQYAKGVVPKEALQNAIKLSNGFDFNVVKWNVKDNTISLFNSPDFDSADEPVAGEYMTITPDGKIKKGFTKSIWHHKWLWVKDDYKGFNVEQSYKRSEKWLSIPDIQFSKIGNKDFWIKNYASKL